jgi:hypothetical protein
MSNNADNEVFVYTRAREGRVPEDVVRVLVDPSVTSIPDHAFDRRSKLTDVLRLLLPLDYKYQHTQLTPEDFV